MIQSIVGCNPETAEIFLEIAGGDVSRAIEMYYEQPIGSNSHPAIPSQPQKAPHQPATPSKKPAKSSSQDPPWVKVIIEISNVSTAN